jgi:hypothetical protein
MRSTTFIDKNGDTQETPGELRDSRAITQRSIRGTAMSNGIRLGTSVRHRRWGSIGTVVEINQYTTGLWIFVQWNESAVEDQLRPEDVDVLP